VTAAILATDLHKQFGDNHAVDGIDLAIEPGEIYGFLGPNGAGKSTTMKVLCTLLTPTSGSASVAGFDVVDHPGEIRVRIGVALQDASIDGKQTGRELLKLQGRLYGLSGTDIKRRMDDVIGLVDIGTAIDDRVESYSGGMKRRLDLAMSLIHRPQILFLDEPTTGLDPEARAAMWGELERLAEREKLTILLTTHYLEEADRLADRLAIVSRGRIVAGGTPEELKRDLEGDAVHVELDDGHGDLALEIVRELGEVHEAQLEGRDLRARVDNGGRAVPGILSALGARGIAVASVTLSRPSLDDVYLHHTGRDFSSDDAEGGS
jgi:ABC-2 type transport system ATP-binding protein